MSRNAHVGTPRPSSRKECIVRERLPRKKHGGPHTPVGFFNGELQTAEEAGWLGGPASFQTVDNASVWGLYDMLGNVAEWTEDCWHENYAANPPVDGSPWLGDPMTCASRVKKGEHYNAITNTMATWYRWRIDQDAAHAFMGVRCAKDLL